MITFTRWCWQSRIAVTPISHISAGVLHAELLNLRMLLLLLLSYACHEP